jgi:branched-chain amino acid aminotransferase
MIATKDNEVIWFDGEFIPFKDATVHVLTHSLHYGMGVFEGVRAYNTEYGPAIFRLAEHTKRLLNSGKILGMQIPYDYQELLDVQKEVVRRNGFNSAYIRPICFYGSESLHVSTNGLTVHTAVAAWQWDSYLGEENLNKGIKVKTASFAKPHINTLMSKAKACGNYMNSTLALQEALSAGCAEALLLDTNGFVAEGSGENIFMIKDGALHTPEVTACLDGITRNSIMELAREFGYQIHERNITRDELYIADELFFTGTAAEVMPISELDGRVIGNGSRGKVTEQLQTAYLELVHGKNKNHQKWLSYLEK